MTAEVRQQPHSLLLYQAINHGEEEMGNLDRDEAGDRAEAAPPKLTCWETYRW